jgi:hypothetical protein
LVGKLNQLNKLNIEKETDSINDSFRENLIKFIKKINDGKE